MSGIPTGHVRAMWPGVCFHATSCFLLFVLCLLGHPDAFATIFGQVQGVVHDPQHRPVSGASVAIRAAHSAFTATSSTNREGAFVLPAVPLGDYVVTVTQAGFRAVEQSMTLASNTTPVMHFELPVGSVSESVTVSTEAGGSEHQLGDAHGTLIGAGRTSPGRPGPTGRTAWR